MEKIKGILVSMMAPMDNHIANAGEKLLGNASSIKRRNDGRVYISGQMQRHVFFSAVERLNLTDKSKNDLKNTKICGNLTINDTYISNGDGISNAIEVDLRADLGGFMHPSAGSYSGRRTAPLTVTPSVAMKESQITRDLLVRMKVNTAIDTRDQALATKEMSDSDIMIMNFFLDITTLSITKIFNYDGEFHVKTKFVKHVNESERRRRVKLFLEASRSMTDFANQARNAVSGEPQKVLIIFDTKLSRKASRYFEADETEKKNIIIEIKERNAQEFIGDDTNGDESVLKAYNNAFDLLNNSTLFDPVGNDDNVKTFANTFPSSNS